MPPADLACFGRGSNSVGIVFEEHALNHLAVGTEVACPDFPAKARSAVRAAPRISPNQDDFFTDMHSVLY